MNLSNVIDAIERFFLDIIGTIIPGIALIYGLLLITDQTSLFNKIGVFPISGTFGWVFIIVTGYAAGHAVINFGSRILLEKFIEPISGFLRNRNLFLITFITPKKIRPNKDLINDIKRSHVFDGLYKEITRMLPDLKKEQNVHDWRNIALSIAPEGNQLIYRFMFISLFNLGMATVLITLSILWCILTILNIQGIVINVVPFNWYIFVFMIIASFLFCDRRYEFYERAMRTPFSMAIVRLNKLDSLDKDKSKKNEEETVEIPFKAYHGKEPIVYLAGGFRSGWQDKFINLLPKLIIYDPRAHGQRIEDRYTFWDLEAIRKCDWIFAYLETDNPGGYALALEVGFAKAMSKRIIFVDEKSISNQSEQRYLGMIRASADVVFEDFEEAIKFIESILKPRIHQK